MQAQDAAVGNAA